MGKNLFILDFVFLSVLEATQAHSIKKYDNLPELGRVSCKTGPFLNC